MANSPKISLKKSFKIIVKKFGGTSVGSIERIESVAERIKNDINKNQYPIIVASAMSGETNRLVDLAHQIDANLKGPAYDMLLASGEQVSISLLSLALEKRGIKSLPLLAYQIGIYTDSLYSKARIQKIDVKKLSQLIDNGIIPIVAGFQGVDNEDRITTLGRGGSDTTAVALAAAFNVNECEIYTDVTNVFTADPRLVKNAKKINIIAFEEMMEMASLGSKVLHIRSVELAAKYNVKIHVRSSFSLDEGTWIVPEEEIMEKPLVSSVNHDPSTIIIQLFSIPKNKDFLANLFESLSNKGVVVDIISQSQSEFGNRLAFSIHQEDLFNTESVLKTILKEEKTKYKVIENVAKISIVGVGMRNHPGVAANFFRTLSDLSIEILLVTTSEIKISAIIESHYLQQASNALHEKFQLGS